MLQYIYCCVVAAFALSNLYSLIFREHYIAFLLPKLNGNTVLVGLHWFGFSFKIDTLEISFYFYCFIFNSFWRIVCAFSWLHCFKTMYVYLFRSTVKLCTSIKISTPVIYRKDYPGIWTASCLHIANIRVILSDGQQTALEEMFTKQSELFSSRSGSICANKGFNTLAGFSTP